MGPIVTGVRNLSQDALSNVMDEVPSSKTVSKVLLNQPPRTVNLLNPPYT